MIASLNGTHGGHWSEAARALELAGASAIELNLYNVTSSTSCSSAELEAEQLEIVRQVCRALSVPVAVKLSPWYTGLAAMTRALAEAGARGAVLFNRFLQPEIDIDTLSTEAHLELSDRSEQRLPLRWIGLLHGRVALDLAASTGIAITPARNRGASTRRMGSTAIISIAASCSPAFIRPISAVSEVPARPANSKAVTTDRKSVV